MIKKVKYTDESNNWVKIWFEDGAIGLCSLKDGIRRQHTDKLLKYIANNGLIEPILTDKELIKINNDIKIKEAKDYLRETDWIVSKIAEVQLLGNDIASLKEKYSVELIGREKMRGIINE